MVDADPREQAGSRRVEAPSSSEETQEGLAGGSPAITTAHVLRTAAASLASVSDTPRLDAELLMAHALGVGRSELLLRRLDQPAPPGFAALLARRLRHEPVAYIRGRQEFWGLELEVSPAVLIPRADSETLIEAARAAFAGRAPARVLDLGTGSGALLLAALTEWTAARGVGIDRSPAALAVARGNAGRLGLAARARLRAADWNAPGWRSGLGRFDLVLANPPYVEAGAELPPGVAAHEPAGALYAEADGLAAYRALLPQLPMLLGRGGVAVFEIGVGQAESVAAMAAAAGFEASLRRDLGGRPRALTLKNSLGKTDDPDYPGAKPTDG